METEIVARIGPPVTETATRAHEPPKVVAADAARGPQPRPGGRGETVFDTIRQCWESRPAARAAGTPRLDRLRRYLAARRPDGSPR